MLFVIQKIRRKLRSYTLSLRYIMINIIFFYDSYAICQYTNNVNKPPKCTSNILRKLLILADIVVYGKVPWF